MFVKVIAFVSSVIGVLLEMIIGVCVLEKKKMKGTPFSLNPYVMLKGVLVVYGIIF